MTRNDLIDTQVQAGGILPPDDSSVPPTYRFCRPPVSHFGDARAEYETVAADAVLFDVSDRQQIELAGSDAASFLHNFCTNDTKRLAAGEGCEAFLTNVKGRILAHILVFVGQQTVWIELGPGREDTVLSHLNKYLFHEDVQLNGRSATFGELYVAGPTGFDRLVSLGLPGDAMEDFRHVTIHREGHALAIRRVDMLGQPGFLLSIERSQLVGLWEELVSSGVRPAGAEAFHVCRIESMSPLVGLDLSEDNLAQEAGRTDRAISFTKGCYLGQEPIARIDALGHINRELCRIKVASDLVPDVGSPLIGDDGQQVGMITSAAGMPARKQAIALACVRTSHTHPGCGLHVQSANQTLPAEVC